LGLLTFTEWDKIMKHLKLLLIIVAVSLSQLPCSAGQPNFCITSPDRPPVWYNRTGDKLSQYLDWSHSKGQLVLHVAYNKGDSTSYQRDQTLIDSFELSFPTVHMDWSKNRLYVVADHGREITIGHVDTGGLESRVILEDNLELSAHRRNGVVQAAIKSVGNLNR
jgi:hypothetical protein